MSELTAKEIDHLSSLARVYLDPDEKASFAEQLPKIVGFVDQLRQLGDDGGTKEETGLGLETLREDKPSGTSLDLATIERLAPVFEHHQVVVPRVLPGNQDA
jgi:aspartyl-tRNA(Asn)/glutamyl-tRNA(Gln) amidotransferase subunit C